MTVSVGTYGLKETGAVGLTGMTRCVLTISFSGAYTANVLASDIPIIIEGALGVTVNPSGSSAAVSFVYHAAAGSDPAYYAFTVGGSNITGKVDVILFGTLGRRDVSAENPQGSRP